MQKPIPTDPDALLTDVQSASLIGSHRATFWRKVKGGLMPKPIRIGGSTRWRRRDLLSAIERHEQGSD